jgi:hypothetical protein
MDLAIFLLLASFAATMGGRAQVLVSALDQSLQRSALLPNTAVFSSVITAFVMAILGAWLAGQLIGLSRAMLIAGGLGLAAIELLWPVRRVTIAEPTRSLGAITLALFGKQLFDAPRWLGFAAAAATQAPIEAGFAVWFGSAMALLAAWQFPAFDSEAKWVRVMRWILAALALLAGGFVIWIAGSHGA